VIVDGYNVIHAWRLDTSPLEDAREALLHVLDDFAGYSGENITVVFDGYQTKTEASEYAHGLITVVFTAYGVTADTHIQRMVKAASAISRRRLKVVTADYLEQLSVFEAGAMRMTPAELKLYIDAAREKHVDLIHRDSLEGKALKTRLKRDALENKE